VYQDFDRTFKGILVPESLLPYEPFVLGLSTESKIPTVLLLDAPWVQRYGVAGWLPVSPGIFGLRGSRNLGP
jgi:hypothetical protein